MEEQWVVDRCQLRAVWLEHPDWSKRELAQAMGRAKSWVKKWLTLRRHAVQVNGFGVARWKIGRSCKANRGLGNIRQRR